LAPNNDIEDRFASAVKSALDGSAGVRPPSEADSVAVQAARPRRSRIWGIALLSLALVAIVMLVVAGALHVRRSNVARLAAEIAAMRPGGAAVGQSEATVVAPEATPASESTAATSSPTITAATEAPTAAMSASAAATAGAFAATPSSSSTAEAATVSPTAV